MNDEIHVVLKEEHHAFQSCPCSECVAERERRASPKQSLQHPLHSLSVDAARTMGYIGQGLPAGSLAAQMQEQN